MAKSPAWRRKEGKDPKGGLNAKGRASAKREGMNLKPPAPNPKTKKDAARKKSFCARMGGARPNEGRKGQARTRKALSLKKMEVLRGAESMNVVAFPAPDEREIMEEIRAWSAHALERNSPYFNGLPPCPYAKAAWRENQVTILFGQPGDQTLTTVLSTFDRFPELVIIVDRAVSCDSDAFHTYLDDLNEAISSGIFGDPDIWVMGFHPGDAANEFVDDGSFEPAVAEEYAMVFVQRLRQVQEAADKLKKLGYYSSYLAEYDAAELFNQREALYRRLNHGNESSEKNGNGQG
jgi:hypothetical protein